MNVSWKPFNQFFSKIRLNTTKLASNATFSPKIFKAHKGRWRHATFIAHPWFFVHTQVLNKNHKKSWHHRLLEKFIFFGKNFGDRWMIFMGICWESGILIYFWIKIEFLRIETNNKDFHLFFFIIPWPSLF